MNKLSEVFLSLQVLILRVFVAVLIGYIDLQLSIVSLYGFGIRIILATYFESSSICFIEILEK